MSELVLLRILMVVQTTTNAELGYRLTLPQDFVAFPAGLSEKNVVGCWARDLPGPAGDAFILCVQRMHAVLGRERLRASDLPPNAQLLKLRWKGFDIDGMRTDTAQGGGGQISIYAAQVPLRKEAIQLIVAGPREYAHEAHAILSSVLDSLGGETNWLTSAERADRLGSVVGWALGIAIGLVIVRIVVTRKRSTASR